MPIATVPIPREDVAKTLDLEESHFLDLKAVEIAPAKLTKSLSAFANADGGELFVGIDEGETKSRNRRAWRGFA